jgi:septum formation protein
MIIDKLNQYKIILASRSPRRQQLLQESGLKFEIAVKEYDETYPDGLNGDEIARFVAHAKAESFAEEISHNEIIIAADTIVWCNGRVLGKPGDEKEAADFLRAISGNTHEVITGVSIRSTSGKVTFSESTHVTFEPFSEEEISYYIKNYQPYDKAGAYGIQEWIGIIACSHIDGSYFNVVGLPVQRLYKELLKFIK